MQDRIQPKNDIKYTN